MSEYRLQIVHAKTGILSMGWQPGDKCEIDLAEDVLTRLKGKVGLFKTEAQVLTAVREAFADMLLDLKSRVQPSRRDG
jgi:hypothetical protein